ncbi:uncharacterized protein CMU_034600 [Cryptosporidium muris RN66]|uniref:Uncharacterized protein n=1 Tax=Cryptosporidium muris (strain RN66) TaxID=441375 RepID=B6AFT3_CRYMR|nr:uncharacterized protein CMU_034600 [Cryptosporidium muris RN66]EEA07074.1 hypothetical protein CMU_034600 [Cryptosporidium muris RN66]|eukprot:XP_002141423.1 hypothetical protein [Cryptosporidium muris RN66]
MEGTLQGIFNTLMESILNLTHNGYSVSKNDLRDFCTQFIYIELITLSSCFALRFFILKEQHKEFKIIVAVTLMSKLTSLFLLLGIVCIELFALIPLLSAERKLPIIEYENQTREAQFRKILIITKNYERIFNINITCDSFARYICGLLLVPALERGELSYNNFCGIDNTTLSLLDIISTVKNY